MASRKLITLLCCTLSLAGCKEKKTEVPTAAANIQAQKKGIDNQPSAENTGSLFTLPPEELSRLSDSLSMIKTAYRNEDYKTTIDNLEYCLDFFSSAEYSQPDKHNLMLELKKKLVYAYHLDHINYNGDPDKAARLAEEIWDANQDYAKSDDLIYQLSGHKPVAIGFWAGYACGSWMGTTSRHSDIKEYIGKSPPEISAEYWINHEPAKKDLEEKVTLLEFMGKDCRYWIEDDGKTCRPTKIPKCQYLWDKYKDELIVIGIYNKERSGIDDIREYVKEKGITFPVAVDSNNRIFDAFGINKNAIYPEMLPQHWLIADGKVTSDIRLESLLQHAD